MLHHVSLEVPTAEVERAVGFWRLLGFAQVGEPDVLGGYVTDSEAAFAALEEGGFKPQRHRELWGQPRAFARMPGGHLVELMAAPPDRLAS